MHQNSQKNLVNIYITFISVYLCRFAEKEKQLTSLKLKVLCRFIDNLPPTDSNVNQLAT